jgi:hypothetical protein
MNSFQSWKIFQISRCCWWSWKQTWEPIYETYPVHCQIHCLSRKGERMELRQYMVFPFVLTVWIICCFTVDHVKWFWDCVDRDHFHEEVQILEAKFECTIFSHAQMVDVWAQLASTASGPGVTAYTHKKAYMYHCLSTECSKAYDIVKRKLVVFWLTEIGLISIGWDGLGLD